MITTCLSGHLLDDPFLSFGFAVMSVYGERCNIILALPGEKEQVYVCEQRRIR